MFNFINVNYKEFSKKKNLGYESISLSQDFGGDIDFKSKGKIFAKDWYNMIKHLVVKASNDTTDIGFSCSSDFDHYFSDGGSKLWDSAWLVTPENKLVYKQKSGCLEFFVPKGTQPTWEELRAMYDETYGKQRSVDWVDSHEFMNLISDLRNMGMSTPEKVNKKVKEIQEYIRSKANNGQSVAGKTKKAFFDEATYI